MIPVSVFPSPESNLLYIRMVVVPMGRFRVFVVGLFLPIVLMRFSDIPVSRCPSISLSHVNCSV